RAAARATAALGIAFVVTALPQLLAWQVIFGRPLLVPHERLHGASFMSLAHPRLLDALMDARGGLFVTHPLMLAAALGLVLLLRRDPRYVAAALPTGLPMWSVTASVFDCYHVRRYTGIVPLLAPGLAVVIAPLAGMVL